MLVFVFVFMQIVVDTSVMYIIHNSITQSDLAQYIIQYTVTSGLPPVDKVCMWCHYKHSHNYYSFPFNYNTFRFNSLLCCCFIHKRNKGKPLGWMITSHTPAAAGPSFASAATSRSRCHAWIWPVLRDELGQRLALLVHMDPVPGRQLLQVPPPKAHTHLRPNEKFYIHMQ